MKNKIEYNIDIDLGWVKLKARKFLGKDRRLIEGEMQKTFDAGKEDIIQTLVMSCLDNYEGSKLSDSELQYALLTIRDSSFIDKLSFDFTCKNKECKHKNNITSTALELGDFQKSEFKLIESGNIKVTVDRDYNEKYLNENYDNHPNYDYYKFLLRIKELQEGDIKEDTFTLDEIEEYLDTLDIEVYSEIMRQYNKMFAKISMINQYKCDKCGDDFVINFDVIPGFFG
jgi:hypothetical protein